MELAIPLIALGGLYFASKNDRNTNSNENEEGFVTNAAMSASTQHNETLPNTDLPDSNYGVEENTIQNTELDRTSKLSTVNKYDSQYAYTDKYFNSNNYPESATMNSFTNLNGEKVNADYFQHSNMTPFFGAKNRSQILDFDATESALDSRSGSGTQYITKEEASPLFSPEDNLQYAHGAPNSNDFYQSRVNTSMRMANVKPFESESVAPGLGLGMTTGGSGGYNSGMLDRQAWMPKTVDQMRTDNNQRASGVGLLGHEGPAMNAIQNIPTSDNIGRVEKNRVERTWDMGYGERNFTTTGIEKKPTARAMPIDRNVHRPETSMSYVGGAGSQLPETYTTGEYMESKHMDLGKVPLGIASMTGRQTATDHDFEMKSKTSYNNNRTTNSQDTYFGAFSSAIGSVVAPLLDELRPSRKENTIGNLRPYQNAHTSISNSYIFNPADRAPPTIRESTEKNKYIPGVNNNGQKPGAYISTEHYAPTQKRDTSNVSYVGNSSAAAGTKELRPYDAEYRQRNNDKKSSTIKGHMVQGNMNLQNNHINMRVRPGEQKNTRPLTHTNASKQFVDADQIGRQHSKQIYNANIQLDRNTPDMLNAFRNNPYTHPIPGKAS
jgi:hypothetical protein